MKEENGPEVSKHTDEIAHKLANFVTEEVIPRDKRPQGALMITMMGEWYPTWMKDPEQAFGFLRRIFSELAEEFEKNNGRKPVFLDLGSGGGMVVACAASTGLFAHCYGVEVRKTLNEWAQGNIQKLESQNIIPKDSVSLISGTYYTAKHWPSIKEGYRGRQASRGVHSDNIENDIRENEQAGHALDQTLLDDNGKLRADVIFWFPSDSFLPDSVHQWEEIIKPGTIFVFNPSSQIGDLERAGFFKSYEHLGDYWREDAKSAAFANLSVYIKKAG